MQLRYEQFNQHLTSCRALASIYFLSGEELLLVQAACDSLRQQATHRGFTEREVFYAELNFDWGALLTHIYNYSLFAEKRIIELHLPMGVPEEAALWLKSYCCNPPANTLLLVTSGKLDRSAFQTTWFKDMNKLGVCLNVRTIEKNQLFTWVTARLVSIGLPIEEEAVQWLVSVTEGNLLAAAQAIEKLSLYHGAHAPPVVTLSTITQVLSDEACFDPFQLADAALQGEAMRCVRILHSLQEKGTEPLLILWALSRECRKLASIAFELANGKELSELFQTHAIWEKRRPLFQKALQRHTLAQLYRWLALAARMDRLIKGALPGNIWSTLQQLSLQLAGTQIL